MLAINCNMILFTKQTNTAPDNILTTNKGYFTYISL